MESLAAALGAARLTGDFTGVHSRYSSLLTFFAARSRLRRADLQQCVHLSIEIVHAVSGDISGQTR